MTLAMRTKMLLPSVSSLVVAGLLTLTTHDAFAQGRRNVEEGFDAGAGVRFEAADPGNLLETLSPDGSLRAKSEHRTLKVWSTDSDDLVHDFVTVGHTVSPTFSTDGKYLIAATCEGNLGCASTLVMWNLETGTPSRLGECIGTVIDISIDANNKKVAATTYYGSIVAMAMSSLNPGTWYGGEIAVFDVARPDAPVRIFCESSGISTLEEILDGEQDVEKARETLKASRAAANRRSLPVRIGLTPDGSKVFAITTTGVVQVFDADTGASELTLGSQSRLGPEMFGETME